MRGSGVREMRTEGRIRLVYSSAAGCIGALVLIAC